MTRLSSVLGYWNKVKAVQCYLFLIVWLTLVSFGLYWYLNRNNGVESGIFSLPSKFTPMPYHSKPMGEDASKFIVSKLMKDAGGDDNHIERLCNPLHTLKVEDENAAVPGHTLEGIIVIFRHGDRGPLTHIGRRNVSHLDCHVKSPELEEMAEYATDTITKLPGYSQFIGPFHSFPKVPPSPYCNLGQLSQLGSAQLLKLGKLLRSTYRSTLLTNSSNNGGTQQSTIIPTASMLKVQAYSTRYRRTFQSLFAFLYGFLGPKQMIQSTSVHESQSVTFCFKHCSCKAIEKFKKAANKRYQLESKLKGPMTSFVLMLNSMLGTQKSKKTANSLLDTLLVYPCHSLQFPCYQRRKESHNGEAEKVGHSSRFQQLISTLKNNLSPFSPNNPPEKSLNTSTPCITANHLKTLISFLNEESDQLKKIEEGRKYHLLNSYGLLREVVNIVMKMIASIEKSLFILANKLPLPGVPQKHQALRPGPHMSSSSFAGDNNNNLWNTHSGKYAKVVVFSSHDRTLQSAIAALGITSGHPDIHLPPFGSRLIFELYRRNESSPTSSGKLYHFRLIYNGQSVTHLVSLCRTKKLKEHSPSDDIRNFLCPIESLATFVHDDYFKSFENASNFKDACKK